MDNITFLTKITHFESEKHLINADFTEWRDNIWNEKMFYIHKNVQ